MVATSTATRVLVMNPAFLQEIKDMNPDLWDTQHQLRQIVSHCDDVSAEIAKQLVRVLNELRDQLALQFALEETYGFLEVPFQSAAKSVDSELVHRVHAEHCPLYLQISDLAERAEELQYRGIVPSDLAQLLQDVKVFDARLRDHENMEGELIEQSLG